MKQFGAGDILRRRNSRCLYLLGPARKFLLLDEYSDGWNTTNFPFTEGYYKLVTHIDL